jgi:hypothetical protein
VRFQLDALIPWADLPVPAPAELADKTRTPTYKAWLCRLGVVPPDAFATADSGPESACGTPTAGGGGGGAFGAAPF